MISVKWFEAAAAGDTKTVQALISACVSTSDSYGRTALMLASFHNHFDIVNILLSKEHGMYDMHFQTALMYAVSVGNVDIVKMLLPYEHLIKTGEEKSALYHAINFEQVECLELLLPYLFTDTYMGLKPLALAVFLKRYKIVAFLLQEQNLQYLSLVELNQARDIASATQDATAHELLDNSENMWQLHGKYVSMKLQATPIATYTPANYSGLSVFDPVSSSDKSVQGNSQDNNFQGRPFRSNDNNQQHIEYLDDVEHKTVSAVISTKEKNTRLQSELSRAIKHIEYNLVNNYLQEIQIDMIGGNTECESSMPGTDTEATTEVSLEGIGVVTSLLPHAGASMSEGLIAPATGSPDMPVDSIAANTNANAYNGGSNGSNSSALSFPAQVLNSNIPKTAWILYCKKQAFRRLRDEQTLNEVLTLIENNKFRYNNAVDTEELHRKRELISGFLYKDVDTLLPIPTDDTYGSQCGNTNASLEYKDGDAVIFMNGTVSSQRTLDLQPQSSYYGKASRINGIFNQRTDVMDVMDTTHTE